MTKKCDIMEVYKIPMLMDQKTKDKLKNIPRKLCLICKSKRSYTNPIAKCYECENDFCYNHILGGQVNDKMKENDKIRDVCKKCKHKHSYHSV